MPEEMNELPEELRELERVLSGVRPARDHGAGRDRVMYEAGRAAGVRAGHWGRVGGRVGCAALVLACVGLLLFPRERVVEKIVVKAPETVVPAPAAQPQAPVVAYMPATPTSRDRSLGLEGLEMRNTVLRLGVDALRDRAGGGGGATMPALRPDDGLDSLPAWQKRAALSTGERS